MDQPKRHTDIDFMSSAFKIVDKDRQLVSLNANPVQRDLERKYFENRKKLAGLRLFILKARQMGVSTWVLAKWFLLCNKMDNVSAVLISHEKEATTRLLSRVHLIKEHLEGVDVETEYESRDKLVFPGSNSRLYIGTAGAKAFGRGDTISHLHCSEICFWCNAREIMLGLNEAVPRNGTIIMESTANGVGEYGHKIYSKARSRSGLYKAQFYPWSVFPEYSLPVPKGFKPNKEEQELMKLHKLNLGQIVWRRYKMSDPVYETEDMFKQEYPLTDQEAFISSGSLPFSARALASYKLYKPKYVGNLIGELDGSKSYKRPKFEPDPRGWLKIWRMPRKGHTYVMGCDVAEGLKHGDYSTVVVIDLKTGEQVAEFRAHLDTDLFAVEIAKLGYFYNLGYNGVEINNMGIAVVNVLKTIYPTSRQYFRSVFDEELKKTSKKLGWRTSETTRGELVSGLARVIRTHHWKFYSKQFIHECYSFQRNDRGKPEAVDGETDDLVIAGGIAWQVYKYFESEGFSVVESREAVTPDKQKSYEQAVQELDVETILNQMDETGGSYLSGGE